MGLFEVIIVVGVIASFLFFMGVLYWALRTRRNRDVPTPTPVHIDRSYREASPAYPTQDYPPEPVQTQSSYDDRSEDFETGRESDSPGDEEVIWGKMPKEETSSVIIPAGKLPGMAAASEDGDLENQEFYGIEGYDYSADYSEEETLEDDEGEGLQP